MSDENKENINQVENQNQSEKEQSRLKKNLDFRQKYILKIVLLIFIVSIFTCGSKIHTNASQKAEQKNKESEITMENINTDKMKISTPEECKQKGLHYIGKMIEPRVNHLSYVLNRNKLILIGGYILYSFPSKSNSDGSYYKQIESIEIINIDNLKEHYLINVENLCNINSIFKINDNQVFLAGKNLYLLDLEKKECNLLDENINILKIFSLKNDLIYYITTNLTQINSYNIKTKERTNFVYNTMNQNHRDNRPNFEVIELVHDSKYILYPLHYTFEKPPIVIIDRNDFSYKKINISYEYDKQKAFIYNDQNIIYLTCKTVGNNTDVEIRVFDIKNNIFSLKKRYKLEGISSENISFIQLNDRNIVFVENYKISNILDVKSFELKNSSQIYKFNYLSDFISSSNNMLFITGGLNKTNQSQTEAISNDIWKLIY